jgi:RHS repeat-associated protein
MILNYYTFSTSPLSQPAKKSRRTASLSQKRFLYWGRLRYHTGKERDSETGLYYYGARYLDSKTSRWLSGDPAMGEYIPSAPVDDEARKRNGNLPGQGGVFNYVNLHVYHYAGNNPVKYVDPDGEASKTIVERQIEAVVKAGIFLIENKGAIQKIGAGAGKVAQGLGIAALGVGGGAALTVGSGGAAALGGVALADAAVVAGGVIAGVGVKEIAVGLAMLSSNINNGTGGGREDYREKTRGANANDKQQIDNVAKETGIDRDKFGKFIHEMKKVEGRGPTDNFKYDELRDLAKQFKELQ